MWSLLVACSLTQLYGQCQEPSQCGLDDQAFLQLREGSGSASTESDVRIPAICPSPICPDEKVEAHPSANLTVLFAFHCPEEGLKKLHQDLMEVSDPQHERYGNWLSKQEADSLCDPDKTVVETWLHDHNLAPEESWPRHLRIKLSTTEAERLFKTSIHRFRRGSRTVVQAEDYFLPRKVDEVISAIYGLNDLPLREAALPPAAPPAPGAQVSGPELPVFLLRLGQLLSMLPPGKQQDLEGCLKQVKSLYSHLSPGNWSVLSQLPDLGQQLEWLRSHLPVPGQGPLDDCLKLFASRWEDYKNGQNVYKQWLDNQMLGGIPNQPAPFKAALDSQRGKKPTFLAGPDVIKQMYQVPTHSTPLTGTTANQSVLSLDNTYSLPLAQWYQEFYGQQVTGVGVLGVSFDNTTSPDVTASESDLDIQMMVGVGPNIPTYVYGVQQFDNLTSAAFKMYFSDLLKMEHPPLVNSMSFSCMQGQGAEQPQIQDGDVDLMHLAARGITMIAASGDDGAGYGILPAEGSYENSNITGEYFFTGPASDKSDCSFTCGLTHLDIELNQWFRMKDNRCGAWLFQNTTPNGTCTMFNMGMPYDVTEGDGVVGGPEIFDGPMGPTWPPMSLYVTSVGSTAPWRNGEVLNQWMPERATNDFGSGGGFACLYPTKLNKTEIETAIAPQRAAVEQYQKVSRDVKPSPSDKCQRGRGFPDVAALGTNVAVATRKAGKFRCCDAQGGTSASAPIFAAIISHLNVERLARGMKPMGFLNPWLYQNPDVFNDVTEGANNIGKIFDYGAKDKYGYSAAEGWDPVTGLGTPNYPKMLQRALGQTPKPTVFTTTTSTPEHKRTGPCAGWCKTEPPSSMMWTPQCQGCPRCEGPLCH